MKTSGCKMSWMATKLVDNFCKTPQSLETMAKFMIASKNDKCRNDPCVVNMSLANQAQHIYYDSKLLNSLS